MVALKSKDIKMPRYKALVSFKVINHFRENDTIFEHDWIQVEAGNADSAKEKAIIAGKNQDEIFFNRYGELISWKFG